MTNDDRPRPQYGEYATPEEQRDAGGFVPPTDLPPTVAMPDAATAVDGRMAAPRPPRPERRTWDVFLTTALLAIGAYVTVASAGSFQQLAAVLRESYEQVGYEPYTNDALANGLGAFLVVFQTVVWIAAAVASIASLRVGRITWWIPVVGGVVALVATIVVFSVAILGDPAFTAAAPGLT